MLSQAGIDSTRRVNSVACGTQPISFWRLMMRSRIAS
jgi:hypothetical protein